MTSLAGRACANHSSLNSNVSGSAAMPALIAASSVGAGQMVPGLSFGVISRLPRVGLAQVDDTDNVATLGKHNDMQAVIDKAVSYPTRLAVAGILVDDSGIPIKYNFIVRTVLRVASLFVRDTLRRILELGGYLYLRIAGYCTNRPCRQPPAHQGMKIGCIGWWESSSVIATTHTSPLDSRFRGNDELRGRHDECEGIPTDAGMTRPTVVTGTIHPGSESGTCFRTNYELGDGSLFS